MTDQKQYGSWPEDDTRLGAGQTENSLSTEAEVTAA